MLLTGIKLLRWRCALDSVHGVFPLIRPHALDDIR